MDLQGYFHECSVKNKHLIRLKRMGIKRYLRQDDLSLGTTKIS